VNALIVHAIFKASDFQSKFEAGSRGDIRPVVCEDIWPVVHAQRLIMLVVTTIHCGLLEKFLGGL